MTEPESKGPTPGPPAQPPEVSGGAAAAPPSPSIAAPPPAAVAPDVVPALATPARTGATSTSPSRRQPPPGAFPWATPVLLGLVLGAIALHWKKGPEVYQLASIAHADLHDASTWYRLVVGLFVHGGAHAFQAVIVVGILIYNGFRTERALGAGGLLVCFVIGGVSGNVVRLLVESTALLNASAATTAGALALVGASASASVRTRQSSFVGAIVSALVNVVVTTLFSAAPDQAASLGRVLPPMLPAAGTAFLVGGFLGAILPLYDPAKRRLLRGALLTLGLGVLGIAAYPYAIALRPLFKPNTDGRPRHVEDPDLEMTWDPIIKKYDFGLPISHRKHQGEDAKHPCVVLEPNLFAYPRVEILTYPRDPLMSADMFAFEQARAICKELPDAKPVDDGQIDGCALGPAYRHVVRVRQDQTALDVMFCVVQAEDDFVIVIVTAEPDDLQAAALARAICRSLKVHSASADKKDGGRSK